MSAKSLKLDFFYLRKAFFVYKKGFTYLKNRYGTARKILSLQKVLQRPVTVPDLSMHILTSHRDFVIALWALASFYRSSKTIGHLYVHNDGTLTKKDLEVLKRLFPSGKVFDSSHFINDYGEAVKKFPKLYEFRISYKNFSFKKIIDPYFVSDKKYRLILDSDILWFHNPQEISDVVSGKNDYSYMQKNDDTTDVVFKDGTKLDENLTYANAGIILYKQQNFEAEKFVEYLERLDSNNPRNLHFADQYGHAYCLNNLHFLPNQTYHIKGAVTDQTIARHYTSPRRALLYIEGIPKIADTILH